MPPVITGQANPNITPNTTPYMTWQSSVGNQQEFPYRNPGSNGVLSVGGPGENDKGFIPNNLYADLSSATGATLTYNGSNSFTLTVTDSSLTLMLIA